MKLRYYMRGLGVGIIVTAILMTVTLNGKTEQLTDAEIIERAKALGMEEKYETTVLSETVSDDKSEEGEEEKPETGQVAETETSGEAENSEGEMPQQTEDSSTQQDAEQAEDMSQEQDSPQPDEIQEIVTDTESVPGDAQPDVQTDAQADEPSPTQKDNMTTVKITVQGGDGSMTVSRKLKEAGVINDVFAYDKFLCRNGYDKKICTGTHEIPVGASDEEIAKIITTRVR